MHDVFLPDSLRKLRSFARHRTLYAFDFDGTLASIVRHSEKARLAPSTAALMRHLVKHVPVAVVTGRSLRDLRSRLGFRPQYEIGNHGLEGVSSRHLPRYKKISRGWKRELLRNWSLLDDDPALYIEDKTYSLTLHVRGAHRPSHSKRIMLQMVEELQPRPDILPGKSVINLMPVGGADKGLAMQTLMKQKKFTHAVYIGDDETDERVFALDSLRLPIFGIRVGEKRISEASYRMRYQSSINRLLQQILEFVS